MEDGVGIAAFRSRQQVLMFENALRRQGIPVNIVSTPRDVALGCGLSVQFRLQDTARVRRTLDAVHPTNLIGLYQMNRDPTGKAHLTVLGKR